MNHRNRRITLAGSALIVALLGLGWTALRPQEPVAAQVKAAAEQGPAKSARLPAKHSDEECTRAESRYDSFWRECARYFGAQGMPPPPVLMLEPGASEVQGAAAYVGPDPFGARQVSLSEEMVMMLAGVTRNQRASRADLGLARKVLLHEWTHFYQSDQVLMSPGREHGAGDFAAAHAKAMLPPKGSRSKLIWNDWRDREQFGDNYGADPTALRWPGG